MTWKPSSPEALLARARKNLPTELPYDLALKIGAVPELAGTDDEPEPRTPLGWAMYWAKRGLYVFPCERFLGIPLSPKWYRDATSDTSHLVEWWSANPKADIAAVPAFSEHYVIATAGDRGLASLNALEEQHGELSPAFSYETLWGDWHFWFKGRAVTSRNYLGPGLHVYGPGTFVYLPASLAPDPDWP